MLYLQRLYMACDALRALLEAPQLVPQSDAVRVVCAKGPLQHEGQQLVLGQVHHRLRAQAMHPRTSLTLQNKHNLWNSA